MKLLVLGINRSPEPVGIGPYTTDMTSWLAARGHEVAMVAAQPYYPEWRTAEGYSNRNWVRAEEDGVSVTRCPLYVPSQPSGAQRIAHHASFAVSALGPMLARARAMRPDVVMAIAPSLLAAPVALLAARACGARTWLHVQDFEVEAAIATGLLNTEGFAAWQAARFEASIFGRFDRVSTISPRMGERLIDKGIAPDRMFEFRNWADIDAVRPLEAPSSYRERWGIKTPHVALYSGNLANKQGIEIVLNAARRLRHRSNDLTFVICGNGPSQARVAAEAGEVNNVMLHDLQPREALGDLLGLASIHLLPQVAGAADLVLPSKLTNILASGRPVVATAAAGTGLAIEVDRAGILTPPGDETAFADAIVSLIDDPALCASMGTVARKRAEERWSRDAVLASVEAEMMRFVR